MFILNKKFLIPFLTLIVIALIYIFFFAGKVGQENLNTTFQETQVPITPQPNAKIFKLSDAPSSNATIINNQIYYFNKNTGELMKSELNGVDQNKIDNSKLLSNAVKIIASAGLNFIGIQYNQNEDKTDKFTISLNNLNPEKPLNQNIRYIAFSPDNQKITYQYYNETTGDNNISISNPDGSSYKNIFNLRLKDIALYWPTKNLIAILTKPSGLSKGYLYTINEKGANFNKILGDIYGLTAKFSPDGLKVLYSQTDAYGRNLALNVMDVNGKTTKSIALKTLPDKCIWSQNTQIIYCAVPKNLTSGQTMPDDFLKNYQFIDDFYKINLETGETEQLYPEETFKYQFNAKDLILDSMETYLIFHNKNDLINYSIKL